MEVKVGQVWRNKVNGSPRVIKDVENDSVKTSTLDGFEHIWHISQLNGYFELVTMENIKPGEWVESIVNVPDGNDTRKGTKLKVSWEEGQNIQFYNRTGSYYKPHFKPCLPPVEENVTKPKTYTNSQIMDMMDKGHYIQDDKVKGAKGQSGWYNESENMFIYKDKNGMYKGLEFAKGDLWTLDLVDRWEEVGIENIVHAINESYPFENIKLKIYGEEVILADFVIDTPCEIQMAKFAQYLAHGTWYKKVNRNDD